MLVPGRIFITLSLSKVVGDMPNFPGIDMYSLYIKYKKYIS